MLYYDGNTRGNHNNATGHHQRPPEKEAFLGANAMEALWKGLTNEQKQFLADKLAAEKVGA